MHFCRRNAEHEYIMEFNEGETPHAIQKTLVERDLGLMIPKDLKLVSQIEKATRSAIAIIGQIKNSFSYFDSELVRLLYISLIRPHLEFAVPVWNPHLKKDIKEIEKIHRTVTRLLPGSKQMSYEEDVGFLR